MVFQWSEAMSRIQLVGNFCVYNTCPTTPDTVVLSSQQGTSLDKLSCPLIQ